MWLHEKLVKNQARGAEPEPPHTKAGCVNNKRDLHVTVEGSRNSR